MFLFHRQDSKTEKKSLCWLLQLNKQSGHQELIEKLAEKERLEAEHQEKIKQLTKRLWNATPSAELKQRVC